MSRSLTYARLACVIALTIPIAAPSVARAQAGVPPELRSLNEGYRDMYNLDFASAHVRFQQWSAEHPASPLGPLSDGAATLFSEFDRMGVFDLELFSDDSRFEHRAMPQPDPAMKAKFEQRMDETMRLAEQALQKSPNDAWALYAEALVCGLRSDYAEFIDKSDVSAFRFSQKATKFAAEALAAKPDLYDAHLAPGIQAYMLSLKSAPVRWIIGLTGSSTNREKGIHETTITAEHGYFLAPFARLMLAVARLREGNKQEAKALLSGLAAEFPHNTLYATQLKRIH